MATENPFSNLYTALNFTSESPAPNDLDRARIAIVSSPYSQAFAGVDGLGGGITTAGLYGILRTALSSNSAFATDAIPTPSSTTNTTNFGIHYDLPTTTFIIRSASSLIGALNVINNNINTIIRSYLPNTPASVSSGYRRNTNLGNDYSYVSLASSAGKNQFLFVRDYLFPGSYTGNTAGILPKLDSLSPPTEDLLGNGITGAFFVYDAISGATPLSRTGLELLTCLELLEYGAIVFLMPSYDILNSADFATPTEQNKSFDAVIMLEQQSLMEGRASSNSSDYGIYGNINYTYASGNTFNFCHGVSAAQFGNSYFNLIERNNALNSEIISSATSELDSAVFIHCGLSGFNVANDQKSITNVYTDIYRYPGFDGLSGSYQNVIDIGGNTAYRLSATELTRTFCVIGKKTRIVEEYTSFGNPDYAYQLDITTPLTIDVGGAITRAKKDQSLYGGIAGLNYSKVLNGGQYSFTLSPTATPSVTQMLKQRRVNYFVRSQQGVYLGADYIGATGSYSSTNRYGVSSLEAAIKAQVTNLIQPIYIDTGTFQNTSATRTAVTNAIVNAVNSNPSFIQIKNAIQSFDASNVVCNSTNNSDYSTTLAIQITVYPRIVATGTDAVIGGLTINVVVGPSTGV